MSGGGLAGAGPLERPVLRRAQAPSCTNVLEGHGLTPGVSVWLGLCSVAALSDTRPALSHGSQVGPPLPSLPAQRCGCPHTSPLGSRPLGLRLPQAPPLPSRGQTTTSPSKGQGWTKCRPRSSYLALDRGPHGAPFQSPGQCAHRGLSFPLACTPRLTGTHQGPASATRKQRDFPWRRLGSALSAWTALLAPQPGSASGEKEGGPRPLGSSRTQGPVQSQAGHRHTGQ